MFIEQPLALLSGPEFSDCADSRCPDMSSSRTPHIVLCSAINVFSVTQFSVTQCSVRHFFVHHNFMVSADSAVVLFELDVQWN